MNLETIQQLFSNSIFWVVIGVIILLILVFVFIKRANKKNARKKLEELEIRYNSLKSIPLSFKLNKSMAIARLNEETMNSVTHSKDNFDLTQSNLKQIAAMLADIEDNISMNKMKTVKADLIDLENTCDLAEKQIDELNAFLDTILEKESSQRAEITKLKDEFRECKQILNDKNSQLSFCWDMIEVKISDIEKQFALFEEWMYASEFEKASSILNTIHEKINELLTVANDFPLLLQEARGFIPNLIDEVVHRYTAESNRRVYLDHLEIKKNTDLITQSLQEDLGLIRAGQIDNINSHLEDYKTRANQLIQQIEREANSFDEVEKNNTKVSNLISDTLQLQDYVSSTYSSIQERYGLGDLGFVVSDNTEEIDELNNLFAKIQEMIKGSNVPSSTILISLKELVQDVELINNKYKTMKEKLDSARADEDRAVNQLLKLQLIINEMQVKIRMNKLPHISSKYEEDLEKANTYVKSIESLLDTNPLDISLLNTTLNEAIDYIYKLYNNVNNLVGMAIMVENTIVFGNKYRSTYPDIDSELTRAELCYRNGEFTQALTIAISTIEKIFPTTYEQLIKENSQSV